MVKKSNCSLFENDKKKNDKYNFLSRCMSMAPEQEGVVGY